MATVRSDQAVAAVADTRDHDVVVVQRAEGGDGDPPRQLRRVGADQHRPRVTEGVTPSERVGLPNVPSLAGLRQHPRVWGRRTAETAHDRREVRFGRRERPAEVVPRPVVGERREAVGEIDQERLVEPGRPFHPDPRAEPRLGLARHRRP